MNHLEVIIDEQVSKHPTWKMEFEYAYHQTHSLDFLCTKCKQIRNIKHHPEQIRLPYSAINHLVLAVSDASGCGLVDLQSRKLGRNTMAWEGDPSANEHRKDYTKLNLCGKGIRNLEMDIMKAQQGIVMNKVEAMYLRANEISCEKLLVHFQIDIRRVALPAVCAV